MENTVDKQEPESKNLDSASSSAGESKNASSWSLIKRFWPWMRPLRRYILWMGILSVLTIPLSIISPMILRRLIDGAATVTNGELLKWALLLIGLTLLTVLFEMARGIFQTLFSSLLSRDLRLNLYLHMQKLSHRYYGSEETGTLMSRQLDDVNNLRGVHADTFIQIGLGMIMIAAYTVMLFRLEWRLALVAVSLIAIAFTIQYMISGEMRRRTRYEREQVTDLSRSIHQSVSGHSLVRAMAAEDKEAGLYWGVLQGNLRANLRKELFNLISGQLSGLIGALAPTLIALLGIYFIMQGEFSVGGLFAFFMYMGTLFASASGITKVNPILQSSLASLERIFQVFDTEPEIGIRGEGLRPSEIDGEISFENVSFGYDAGELVLSDLDLKIPARSTVAFVGPSGSGKSTLANLVPRFYDPTAGRVLLDGRDLKDLDPSWLRGHVGLVSQQIFLFDRSVSENLAYSAPNATMEDIREAARCANALEFIEAMPEGFDTLCGEGGARLSGGQRQRLAIAREILSNPSILILDEATSALDSETEALIQQALEKLFEGRTALVIAHRLSTIRTADMIVVVEKGQIVERGKHEELVSAGGLYSRLCESQFGKTET